MQLGYQIFSSPLGEILVAGTDSAITEVRHGTDKTELSSDFLFEHGKANALGRTEYIKDACESISNYLEGKSSKIGVAIQLDGTPFQRKVWNALRKIPYGTTVSYSDIAEEIGEPDAFRAVANACAGNPMPLIIPCHRVIHKNGEMSGFAWGEDAKRFLLELEQERVAMLAEKRRNNRRRENKLFPPPERRKKDRRKK